MWSQSPSFVRDPDASIFLRSYASPSVELPVITTGEWTGNDGNQEPLLARVGDTEVFVKLNSAFRLDDPRTRVTEAGRISSSVITSSQAARECSQHTHRCVRNARLKCGSAIDKREKSPMCRPGSYFFTVSVFFAVCVRASMETRVFYL